MEGVENKIKQKHKRNFIVTVGRMEFGRSRGKI